MAIYSDLQLRALNVIKAEIEERRRCTLSHGQVAKLAGVGKWTVRAALEKAEQAGELVIQRRPVDGLANVVRAP